MHKKGGGDGAFASAVFPHTIQQEEGDGETSKIQTGETKCIGESLPKHEAPIHADIIACK